MDFAFSTCWFMVYDSALQYKALDLSKAGCGLSSYKNINENKNCLIAQKSHYHRFFSEQ